MTTNQNEARIITRIEELRGDLALNFKQICELLVMLKSHYLHKDPLFRFYREVASEKLIPEVVMALGLRQGYLPCLIGRPRELQQQIARDADLTYCTIEKGEIVEKRTSWKKMRAADFKRMFPEGEPVRTPSEQRAILQAELAQTRPTHIRGEPLAFVDAGRGTFHLGSQAVPLSVVLNALREADLIPSHHDPATVETR